MIKLLIEDVGTDTEAFEFIELSFLLELGELLIFVY
jgi:hypothetical protein